MGSTMQEKRGVLLSWLKQAVVDKIANCPLFPGSFNITRQPASCEEDERGSSQCCKEPNFGDWCLDVDPCDKSPRFRRKAAIYDQRRGQGMSTYNKRFREAPEISRDSQCALHRNFAASEHHRMSEWTGSSILYDASTRTNSDSSSSPFHRLCYTPTSMSSALLGSDYAETPAEVGGQHASPVFFRLLPNSVILS